MAGLLVTAMALGGTMSGLVAAHILGVFDFRGGNLNFVLQEIFLISLVDSRCLFIN